MEPERLYAFAPEAPALDGVLEPCALAPAPEQEGFAPAPQAPCALFGPDGHFTEWGVRAVAAGTLDELQRLEAAEHLSFCDGCLERYTAMLADDTLLTPARPIAPPVLSRIRRRAVSVLFSRYATAAAAACFALGIWGTGVFNAIAAPTDYRAALQTQPDTTVVARMSDFFRGAHSALEQSVDNALKALARQRAQQ